METPPLLPESCILSSISTSSPSHITWNIPKVSPCETNIICSSASRQIFSYSGVSLCQTSYRDSASLKHLSKQVNSWFSILSFNHFTDCPTALPRFLSFSAIVNCGLRPKACPIISAVSLALRSGDEYNEKFLSPNSNFRLVAIFSACCLPCSVNFQSVHDPTIPFK